MAQSFDYIVIGAGSAGAVVASRLTEDKDVSVLLLEAGGRDNHPFQQMPLAFMKVSQSKPYIWSFESEPEPGLGGRRLPIRRGRSLGGSSAINAMIAIRGNRVDYDLWRQQGLEGWGYEDVLPYFKKLENNWRGEGPYHGAGGPVQVTPVDFPEMLFEPFKQSAMAAGLPFSEDPNGASQDGVSRMESTTGGGKRSSTAAGYLRPAMGRPNLHVETRALTTRIVVEKGRAVAVEYTQGGQAKRAYANSEIVLSGGSFNSPQIMLLSGIGPADELKALGVTPVHDLPGVGRNLQEHPNFLNIYRAKDRVGMTKFLRLDRAAWEVARWFARKDGAFATNGAAANVFLKTVPGLDRPDAQLIAMTLSNSAELWAPFVSKPAYCFSIRLGALHPASRGWVKLRSSDPGDAPRIQYNMLTDPEDMATMVRGLRMCREIYGQSPIRDLIESEIAPGAGVQSDADLAAAIRREAGHRSHPIGTCRMGLGADAVVDAQLRVHGVAGLRIADASIMPELPSGNTNMPSIMIGEKAADMLRGRSMTRAG
ncbi:MAG: hypothetical protein JWN93_2976 [Hyphomicrobiales bacterium]|nr:hypothetical protein [Hyphomicrobiales bacterium]